MKERPRSIPATSSLTVIMEIAALAAAIVAAFIGSGALGGTSIQDAAGGFLSADATLLSPAGPAFSIWSFIYLGLTIFAIFQATPTGRRSKTLTTLRLPVALSALLNAAWIAVVQFDLLALSVVVIFVLTAVLIWILVRLVKFGTSSRTEHWIMWLTFGVYLGWVNVASIANVAALLSSWNVGFGSTWAPYLALALLATAVIIAMGVCWYSNGKLYTALAMGWGIAWIGHSRLSGSNESSLVGYGALIAAAVLLGGAILISLRRHSRAEVRNA